MTADALAPGAALLPVNTGRFAGLKPDLLDYCLFLPGIWLCCGLGVSLRLLGPFFSVVPVGFCLLYGLLRRVIPPRLLGAYLAFCIVVAIVSAFRLMPNSWQTHFMQVAIIRQLVPMVGFFSVAWASKAYFRRRLAHGDVFAGASFMILLSIVVAPIVMFEQGIGYEGDYSIFAILALYGGFTNNVVIAMFYVTGAICLTRDWRRYAGLAGVLAIAVSSHFIQFRILMAMVFAVVAGAPGRKLAMAIVVVLVGTYAAGVDFVPEMMLRDPNDGLRLAFIADTLTSVADTHGIGVGYGTESVRWDYRFPGMPVFTFLPDPDTMTRARMLEALSSGVENSFAEALLRTGLPGLLLLSIAFFGAFPSRRLPRDVRNHAAIVFTLAFVTCFVNPALETPIQTVGVGFIYGYLIALRAHTLPRVGFGCHPVQYRGHRRGRPRGGPAASGEA